MQYLLHSFSVSCNRVETLLMKQQRGKVSKPRGLVQRREQADKEVKSWSPSKPSYSDFVVSFLFLTTRHVSLSLSLLSRHRTIFLSIPTCI